MPHQHLSFQSLHSFQRNADNDDDGSTADCQILDKEPVGWKLWAAEW